MAFKFLNNLANKLSSKANSKSSNEEQNQPSPWDSLTNLKMNQDGTITEKSEEREITWDDVANLKMEQRGYIPEKLERLEDEKGNIDTNNPETIKKYRDNLNYLANKIKQEGRQDKFLLIRDDDNFPHGYKWEIASAFTQTEPIRNALTFALRRAIVKQNHPELVKQKPVNSLDLAIPGQDEENTEQINKEAAQLDPSIGTIYGPAHFRSTKHFTINTALGHTGSYNQVDTNRNFTVIDTIDNFKKSPYRYSLAYEDAYLDLSHEQLEISENAVILMSKERYDELKNDKALMDEINERKLITYSGDESTAINMYLSEQGIFPNNVGTIYHEHDPKAYDILESSIKDLAKETNTPYQLNHGNFNGGGGHFSSYFDDNNEDFRNWQHDFVATISNKFPDCKDLSRVMVDPKTADRFIEEAGVDNVMAAINEINQNFQNKVKTEREQYYEDRMSMSAEDKQLMQNTVHRIQNFFKDTENYALSHDRDAYEPVKAFYQSRTVKEQIEAAKQLNQFFDQHPVHQ